MKSVYMINGFLESGKSEFIRYTLEQPYFQIRETTLLILCEEGEVEFDRALLRRSGTVLEVIEEEADFTTGNLTALEKKHKPERIIIEYNGMWNYKKMCFPNCTIYIFFYRVGCQKVLFLLLIGNLYKFSIPIPDYRHCISKCPDIKKNTI